ncbi:nucleoside hydrolase [Curtobacterium ammoniigenes]|uniref:nucleoside hydrolase n=1 Tax=Curtobacterium ammoniigenes TaxID=395387 RepID=UPI00082B89F3|nr:nucleoside hydrolase [Curtobacterium ammoniigenes]
MLLYLDCDPGIDDALALGYLIAHPDVDLALVGSVSGNTDAATAAVNARGLLRLFGRPDIPVATGAHDFLSRPFHGGAPHVHGDNGIGGVALDTTGTTTARGSAAEELVALARSNPGQVRILAIGPLTNLALALDLEPTLPSLVHDVVVMGGAALAPGNITPAAEANIFGDPEAAARVLDAAWDLTMVPLDATMHQRFEAADLEALLASDRRPAQVLGELLAQYFDFYSGPFGRPSAALHDPLAAGILTGEAIATRAFQVRTVVDTTDGPGRGQTIADLRGSYHPDPKAYSGEARWVLAVDEPFAPTLLERLLSLD